MQSEISTISTQSDLNFVGHGRLDKTMKYCSLQRGSEEMINTVCF